MRRETLALVAALGLLASGAFAQFAPAARADGPAPVGPCGLMDVNVTATGVTHNYDFSYGCYFFGTAFDIRAVGHVSATYNVTTSTASEQIQANYAGEAYTSSWTCATDPSKYYEDNL